MNILSFKKWKLALVNINVDYTDQLFLKDDVYIKTWIEKIGKTSFQIGERIEQTSRICAKGTATYVNYNFRNKQPEKLSDNIKKSLEALTIK